MESWLDEGVPAKGRLGLIDRPPIGPPDAWEPEEAEPAAGDADPAGETAALPPEEWRSRASMPCCACAGADDGYGAPPGLANAPPPGEKPTTRDAASLCGAPCAPSAACRFSKSPPELLRRRLAVRGMDIGEERVCSPVGVGKGAAGAVTPACDAAREVRVAASGIPAALLGDLATAVAALRPECDQLALRSMSPGGALPATPCC